MQARLIKGIQKPRPEFETVGACLIMLHGISDAGANLSVGMLNFWGIRSLSPYRPWAADRALETVIQSRA